MGIDLSTATLAIDGGGTNCRIALESRGQRFDIVLGATNVATDFNGATESIRSGLIRMAATAGVSNEALCGVPAYVGLAGVLGSEDSDAVRRALPLKVVTVEDDRRSAVRGALGRENGALAGLGTGSFMARQKNGAIRLVGGWGARLGDQGSGFWIGRQALSATLDAVDGLIPHTALTRDILARYNTSPRDIVAFAKAAMPGQIAELAPMIVQAAGTGDTTGGRILRDGANYVVQTLQAIGWQPGEPLCLIGGVSRSYLPYLPTEVAGNLAPPRGTAIDGALDLARDLVRSKAQ